MLKELRLGVNDRATAREYRRLVGRFRTERRILVPTWQSYERSGVVLQKMRSGGIAWQTASALGDVLIAMSSKQVGATVITRDHDFERIKAIDSFKLEVI